MKKSILFILFIFSISFSFSQNNESETKENLPTTIEEYNYMTKGYKIQQNSGLDMKKGYSFETLATIQRGNYTFSFKALMREEKKQLAGILIIGNSKVSGRNYYLGMPVNNSQLQSEFENDIKNWDESMTTAFAQSISELYSKLLLNKFIIE